MSIAVEPALTVDDAVDELVRAIDGVDDLVRLRFRVVASVHSLRASSAVAGEPLQELEETAGVWLALDRLVQAVAARAAAGGGSR